MELVKNVSGLIGAIVGWVLGTVAYMVGVVCGIVGLAFMDGYRRGVSQFD